MKRWFGGWLVVVGRLIGNLYILVVAGGATNCGGGGGR